MVTKSGSHRLPPNTSTRLRKSSLRNPFEIFHNRGNMEGAETRLNIISTGGSELNVRFFLQLETILIISMMCDYSNQCEHG